MASASTLEIFMKLEFTSCAAVLRGAAGSILSAEMEFHIRAGGSPARLAILPGAFNPVTRAHTAMAEGALAVADEVLFVLPRVFPHKDYTAAGVADRLALLRAAVGGDSRFSLATSGRGLFIDLSREARAGYGPAAELFLLCGSDAAERIAGWDYGPADGIHKQLEHYGLLVASRGDRYEPPPELRERVRSFDIPAELAGVSSSEVRRRLRAGERWQELVPPSVAPLIEANPDIWR
jgi:nicotinate-nucleotide adenylyltransferase